MLFTHQYPEISNTLGMWCEEPTHWKRPWSWERLRAGEKRVTEDEMVGWHHRLSRHEFEQTPGDSEGQESLVCCSPWGHKELDVTEWLNTPWYQFSLPLEGLFCYESRKGRASWGSRIPNQATTTIEVFMSMWTDKYPKWKSESQKRSSPVCAWDMMFSQARDWHILGESVALIPPGKYNWLPASWNLWNSLPQQSLEIKGTLLQNGKRRHSAGKWVLNLILNFKLLRQWSFLDEIFNCYWTLLYLKLYSATYREYWESHSVILDHK